MQNNLSTYVRTKNSFRQTSQTKLVIRLQMNFTKGYFQMTFFVKNSKFLPKYHPNLFPKSRFSKYINPWLVILFCEVQNQNKQKCASRYLYQNNNKRSSFLTQKSDSWQKQIWKYCNILWKTVKTCHTFIYWEPNNKLAFKLVVAAIQAALVLIKFPVDLSYRTNIDFKQTSRLKPKSSIKNLINQSKKLFKMFAFEQKRLL